MIQVIISRLKKMGHFKEICKECGIVIKQCRCPGEKTVIESTCDSCAGTVTLLPDTKQQLREALAREVYLNTQITQLTQRIEQLEKSNEK